jgi:hypothetical protein
LGSFLIPPPGSYATVSAAGANDATEIGSFPVYSQMSATRVVERGGELVYAEEIPITGGWMARPIGRHVLARFEIKSPARADSPIKNGHHAVLALYPYSLRWCQSAPFKPPRNESRAVLSGDPSALELASAALEYVSGLSCDFWETRRYRTAGFFGGPAPHSWSGQNETHSAARHVLGVCEDADEARRQLFADPRTQKLLEDTRKGRLRIGVPGAGIVPYDEVADEAPELLILAIVQALAGPHSESKPSVAGSRSVFRKVDRIYRDLLNARNRSVGGRRRREAPPREDT